MSALLYVSASLAIVLAAYLATGTALPQTSRRLLAAALLTIAALNLLARLQIEDPGHLLVMLRPVLAMALPALLFLHVATATRVDQELRLFDVIHVTGPLIVTGLYATPISGQVLDVFIVLAHATYLSLIAWVSRYGAVAFATAGTQLAVLFDRWRRLVMLFLIVAILFDTFVMLEVGGDASALAHSWVIALSGILLVCGLSYLLIAGLHRAGPLIWAGLNFRRRNPGQQDLIGKLEKFLLSTRAYLDPNLTLKRFARRSGLQMREISVAINDQRQCNYNQWLNSFRIKEAQRILRKDPNQNMTEVMFAAGFQNKSTFNAAFRAACGESPSSWRNRIDEDAK